MAYQENLSTLAMNAMAKYIYSLCSKLICIPVDNKTAKRRRSNSQIERAKIVCERLHAMIRDLPPQQANDVSNKLLDCIDNWDFEIGHCKKGHMDEKIYTELINSVIHPAVTRIEPMRDLLDCANPFHESVFCSSMCAHAIIRKAQCLSHLVVLHIIDLNMSRNIPQVDFPEQLVEISLNCNDELLLRIAESCKRLKYLDLYGSKGVTNVSAEVILQIDSLVKLNISRTSINQSGIKCLVKGLSERAAECNLRYLATSYKGFEELEKLQCVPNLTLTLLLYHSPFVESSRIHHLCSLKNLVALQIRTSLNSVNKILREIGKQLIFLDVEILEFYPDDSFISDGLKVTDVLKVGQYCTALKCLHLSIGYYRFPQLRSYNGKLLPGFQNITCLALEIENESIYCSIDFSKFIISQCVSLKKLLLEFDRYDFNVTEFVTLMVESGYMKNMEIVSFQPFCDSCVNRKEDMDHFELSKVDELVHLLLTHCPKLRMLGVTSDLVRLYEYKLQRLRIVPTWCRCK